MSLKIIDLSVVCSNNTPGVSIKLQDDLPVYLGYECYAYDLDIKSHTGTYFETSSHLFRNGTNTDRYPLDNLILPCFCARINSSQRCITASMLESAAGEIKPNHALLVDTCGDKGKYFSKDAAVWMAQKKVKLFGSNVNRYDTGFENPTGFFVDLFEAEIPIIASLRNLEMLERNGLTLIVLPLKIHGVCTVPCRVVAVYGLNL